jgi:hypothetical protein
MLHKGVCKNAPRSSNSTRPLSRQQAYRAVQGHMDSRSSIGLQLAHNPDICAAEWDTVAASSSSMFPVVRGQQWLQAAALALLQLHLVSGITCLFLCW